MQKRLESLKFCAKRDKNATVERTKYAKDGMHNFLICLGKRSIIFIFLVAIKNIGKYKNYRKI